MTVVDARRQRRPADTALQVASARANLWRAAAASVGALFVFVLLKNAWLSDDFWIFARQVEQLLGGAGLRWNPHERIQLFTSVVGFFLTAFGRLLTDDYFVNFAVQAVALNSLTLVLLARLLKTPARWTAAVLLLTASNSYMDYAWSGLHNPVGHAMLAGLLIFLNRVEERPADETALFAVAGIAGLAPLFRHDFALIVWPPAFFALWEMRRACRRKVRTKAVVLLLMPLAAWTLFALLYFGFPLPVTAYNKLGSGIPRAMSIQNGLHYVLFTVRNDPPVLPLVVAALAWMFSRTGVYRHLALGAALHLCYTVFTGADYMGGRFFTYPYLLAVIVVVDRWGSIMESIGVQTGGRTGPPVLAACACLWMVALPHTPLKAPAAYHKADPIQTGGIADERSAYHRGSSVLDYLAFRRGDADTYPDHPSMRLGGILARTDLPVIHLCDLGMAPFAARTDQKFIDVYGFSDVLQALLPDGGVDRRPAHYIRRLPEGYLESVAAGQARIADPRLNRHYDRLRLVTQSDGLFAAGRIGAIVAVNVRRPPVAHIDWPPIAGGFRLPLLCRAKHDPNLLAWLDANAERLTAADLNNSSLASYRSADAADR